MMKVNLTVEMNGRNYKLKESVVVKMKKAMVAVACVGMLTTGVSFAVSNMGVSEEEVVYKEVYIGGSSYGTAYSAIEGANDGSVDVRDLMDFFKKENGLSDAGSISEGTYMVPVYSK